MSAGPSRRVGALLLFAAALAAESVAPEPAAAQSGRYDLLVASRGTGSIKRYDAETRQYLGDFVNRLSGNLQAPEDMLLGPNGDLLVTGHFSNQVLRYDRRSGALIRAFSFGFSMDNPTEMAVGPDGDVYVSQRTGTRSVIRFDGMTGDFVEAATPGIEWPMGLAWDEGDTLHVASFGRGEVQAFDGGMLDRVFTSGIQMGGAVDLWFAGGDLFVIDGAFGSVRRFDAQTGAYLDDFITGIGDAEAFAHGPDGRLYIADRAFDVVNAYDSTTGAFIETFVAGGGLDDPTALLFLEREPDFFLELLTATVTVVEDGSSEVQLNVEPERGLAFPDAVALSCEGAPAGVTCSIEPGSVVPGQNGAVAAVRFTGGGAQSAGMPGWLALLLLLGAAGAVRVARSSAGDHPRRLAAAALTVALFLTGCGIFGPDLPPVTSTVTITGEFGPLERTVEMTVTYMP